MRRAHTVRRYARKMGLLDGKKILVTGVLTDSSLAFGVARRAIEEGADVMLTGAGRGLSLTQRTARKLSGTVTVGELDVTVPEHFSALAAQIAEQWGRVDGVLHAIGFAPGDCLGDDIWKAEWSDVSIAMQISAYSYKALAHAMLPLWQAAGGGSLVGLDFDAARAFPAYNWMGVAKAAFESLSRYLARDLAPSNVRSNLVAAGPVRTIAAKSIPGFAVFEDRWKQLAPLGWDVDADADAVARACVVLLSDWFPKTTGEIVHVDGGFHAMGA